MAKKNIFAKYGYRSIAFISLLILLYNPPVFGVQITKLLYIVSLIYFILDTMRLYPQQVKLILIGGFLVCYGMAVTLLNEAADFNMMGFSRLFTGVISSTFIMHFIKLSESKFTEFTVIKWIVYVAIFESIIVLLAFFSPTFHEFILILCGGTSQYADRLSVLSSFRGIGWTFAQYSDFAVCQGISFLCMVVISLHTLHSSFTQKSIIFISFILLIISGFLIGRTFQFILVISFIYYLWYIYKIYGLFKCFKIIIFVTFTLSISIYLLLNILNNHTSNETLDWTFEFLKNFGESDKLRSDSTDELYQMWFLPQSDKTLLFGDGRYLILDSNLTYSGSDVGFVNSIYYWGIFGSILYYYCICKVFYYSYKEASSIIIKGLSVAMLFTIIIYNTKGVGNAFPYSCLLLEGVLTTQSNKFIQNKNRNFISSLYKK